MTTPFVKIYDSFLNKVNDSYFLNFTEDELKEILEPILSKAVNDFSLKCDKDLSLIDYIFKEFQEDLGSDEVEILSMYMLLHYMNTKVYSSQNLNMMMVDSNMKIFSQANHLAELQRLKEKTQLDISRAINVYKLKNGLKGLNIT